MAVLGAGGPEPSAAEKASSTTFEEEEMRIPRFRTSVYGALALGVACFFSPFGWGATHSPFPTANLILSFVFYSLVVVAGLWTAQAWRQAGSVVRWPMLLLTAGMIAATVWIGYESLFWQLTSAHYQWAHHSEAIWSVFGILGSFVVLETIRRVYRRFRRTDV